MNKMNKFSKVNSLNFIKKNCKNIKIPNYIYFSKGEFNQNRSLILKRIYKEFKEDLIIRSSALNEDTKKLSNAGKYDSLVLKKKENKNLEHSILKVIRKFKSKNDQILIQKFINKPSISGVVFTKDINTNSDYYQIEFDVSKRTDLVTSGKFNPSLKTLIIYKNSSVIPKKFRKLITICKIFEKLFDNNRLDIEFCIKNNQVFIFQCRPLLGTSKISNILKHKEILVNLKKKFKKINLRINGIYGNSTILSNMSDWNPAEMIGVNPCKLALSLYSELITDTVWSEQRLNYGYKDVRPNRLMVDMSGSPYIDLRIDINSFLPINLDKTISSKIVNNAINVLKKKPELHDKLEFEVIDTCFNFSLKKKVFKFLNKDEKKIYIKSLKELTNNIINPKNKILDNEIKKNNELINKINSIKKTNLSHIQKIFYLIYDCKTYGTLPFAGIARCAFMSKSILDSLYNEGFLKLKEIENFNMSIETVSTKINNEFISSLKKNNFKDFILKYGHLRPSMYSILNKNYKENFRNYFSINYTNYKKKKINLKISNKRKNIINNFFKKNNLLFSFEDFIKFAKKSIENRENSKLIFSKSIDEIFINLKKLAVEINIDYKNFEHLDIKLIKNSFNNLSQEKLRNLILRNIKKNKEHYTFAKNIKTPDVITSTKNFDYFDEISSKENYVTEKNILGDMIELKKISNLEKLKDKIILIESADPGYDFIFSYNIKGLITKYGGKNSHMAIRCNELNLPSIIGVGEKTYRSFINSKKIYIDCKNEKFETFL